MTIPIADIVATSCGRDVIVRLLDGSGKPVSGFRLSWISANKLSRELGLALDLSAAAIRSHK